MCEFFIGFIEWNAMKSYFGLEECRYCGMLGYRMIMEPDN